VGSLTASLDLVAALSGIITDLSEPVVGQVDCSLQFFIGVGLAHAFLIFLRVCSEFLRGEVRTKSL
jgi:hypothetical protein